MTFAFFRNIDWPPASASTPDEAGGRQRPPRATCRSWKSAGRAPGLDVHQAQATRTFLPLAQGAEHQELEERSLPIWRVLLTSPRRRGELDLLEELVALVPLQNVEHAGLEQGIAQKIGEQVTSLFCKLVTLKSMMAIGSFLQPRAARGRPETARSPECSFSPPHGQSSVQFDKKSVLLCVEIIRQLGSSLS